MEIQFSLAWIRSGNPKPRDFKFEACYRLFCEYLGRISKFVSCEATTFRFDKCARKPAVKVWLCERSHGALELDSQELAAALKTVLHSGVRVLQIVVGGPDGFSGQDIERLHPDLKWSFGKLTLPHELAAVVASEQIYRAWTILRRFPYHNGHDGASGKNRKG
ncbi:MAG: 23S rRNA (pseudouridine(1915)-N(3))-methyltransferase RlmH [Candidatus Omnitrophica bacterium]|nr:23S rRNA (pseudouridine(1915)-N(3))-methyltransferase RlmH [Candidatus Omnitrophota bacterium]